MAEPDENRSENGSQASTPAAEDGHAPKPGFPVVGMGASAGGLEAFKTFLRAMPPDSGMAFVLVQHLDPTRESLMAELLAVETAMPVAQVQQDTRIEPNRVYMIPPNAYLAIEDGVLHLTEPSEPRGRRRPIDIFFRSLAEDQGEQAIAVVCSGTGTNGASALKDVKVHGGMVMVQDPGTAGYDGMPRAAIASGMADCILPMEKMPEMLLNYARQPYLKAASWPKPAEADEAAVSDELETILTLLRARQDFDFRHYKKGTLLRRIQRRMGLNHIQRGADYLTYLRQHPAEVEALARDLMISVTHFFRDPPAWTYVEKTVLPQLVEQQHTPLRIWVPGCATGEEAYTLAILVTEQLRLRQKNPSLHLFASDLNRDALTFARAGLYPDGIAADITAARLQRFFHPEDQYYRVNKEIRDLLTFAVQNLISDPPFGRLGLISCRNLLIYLEPETQEKVINLFHFALKPGGWLFLGNSETVGGQSGLFEAVSKKWRVYRRIGPSQADKIVFPVMAAGHPRHSLHLQPAQPPAPLPAAGRLAGFAQQVVLERHTKACVLVNSHFDILYLFGPVYDYLMQPTGELTANLLVWAREGLRTRLRGLLQDALHRRQTVTADGIRLKRGNDLYTVSCTVEPLAAPREGDDLLLVVFEDQPAAPAAQPATGRPGGVEDSVVSQLEYELKLVREELRSTVDQLESSNEEFKATNEEMISINEELQSTNEELETSKEELQSLNEELITTNQQLESKNLELEATNDDLKNLLASTQIATLFLDRCFGIRRFTPAMTRLMRLIATDVGRCIEDITSRFSGDGLLRDAAQVLEQLTPVETEIQADDGRWYLRRTVPYRTADNRIDGVVITFIDITEHKLGESRQRFLVELYDAIRPLQEAEDIIATAVHLSGRYFNVSRCAYGIVDERCAQVSIQRDYHDQVASQAGTYSLDSGNAVVFKNLKRDRLLAVDNSRTDSRTATAEQALPCIGDEARAVLMVPLVKAGQVVALFTLSHRQPRSWSVEDMALAKQVADRIWLAVEKARTDQALRLSEERFRIALKNSSIMVFNLDSELRYAWVHNPAIFSSQPLLGRRDSEVLERPEDSAALELFKRNALDSGQSGHRTVSVYGDGRQRWYDLTVEPLRQESGRTVGLIGAAIDITERVALETQLRHHAGRLAEADRHKNNFLAMLGHELRNPLAPIRNAVDTLKVQQAQGALEGATLHWGLDIIDRQSRHLALLVNDLLDVARITQNRIELRKQPVALTTIVRQAEEMTKPLIDGRRQQLTVVLPEEALYLEADPDRLAQVMANLLNNAAKYTDREGQIRLEVQREDSRAVIRVRDSGIGIPAELLPKVFDLFFQVDHGTDRRQGGLGLGLTLARRLVEMHGGQMQAASAGPGQGSEFIVRLPLLAEGQYPAPSPDPMGTEPVAAPARRILVVDDKPDIADSLAMLLKIMGHRVEVVYDGQAALEAARAFEPELVLLDIGLPGMDGYEVARRLRRLYPSRSMRLVALTGYGQEEDLQRAREAGFDQHCLKPGSQEMLETLLGSLPAA